MALPLAGWRLHAEIQALSAHGTTAKAQCQAAWAQSLDVAVPQLGSQLLLPSRLAAALAVQACRAPACRQSGVVDTCVTGAGGGIGKAALTHGSTNLNSRTQCNACRFPNLCLHVVKVDQSVPLLGCSGSTKLDGARLVTKPQRVATRDPVAVVGLEAQLHTIVSEGRLQHASARRLVCMSENAMQGNSRASCCLQRHHSLPCSAICSL